MAAGYSGDEMGATGDWVGSKGALLLGDRLLVTLRDDFDWIPYPGHWDFVGGEREPGETPRETLVREAREEVGLDLSGAEWLWEAMFPSFADPTKGSWFFVLQPVLERVLKRLHGEPPGMWGIMGTWPPADAPPGSRRTPGHPIRSGRNLMRLCNFSPVPFV